MEKQKAKTIEAVFTEFDGRVFNFKNVEKIEIDGKYTNIGYIDDSGEYHEEVGDTPKMIIINTEESDDVQMENKNN